MAVTLSSLGRSASKLLGIGRTTDICTGSRQKVQTTHSRTVVFIGTHDDQRFEGLAHAGKNRGQEHGFAVYRTEQKVANIIREKH